MVLKVAKTRAARPVSKRTAGAWGVGREAGGVKKGTGIRRPEARDDVRGPERLAPTERSEPGSLIADLWPRPLCLAGRLLPPLLPGPPPGVRRSQTN